VLRPRRPPPARRPRTRDRRRRRAAASASRRSDPWPWARTTRSATIRTGTRAPQWWRSLAWRSDLPSQTSSSRRPGVRDEPVVPATAPRASEKNR
jgi:hypothetical protein